MSDPASNADRLFELAGAICDESASEDERVELDSLVGDDEALRRQYWDYCWVHVTLGAEARVSRAVQKTADWDDTALSDLAPWEIDALTASSPRTVPPISPLVADVLPGPLFHGMAGFFASGWPVAYLVATVVMAVGLLIGAVVHVSQPEQIAQQSVLPSGHRPEGLVGGRGAGGEGSDNVAHSRPTVGRITGMVACQFDRPKTQDPRPKTIVSLGDTFALASGLLEITYDTGAKVILQGPVTYEVESPAGGFLSLGRLTARLEKKAEELNPQPPIPNPSLRSTIHDPLFTITTPTATVTDLGTEFGVEVSKQGMTQVHVLRGLVEARGIGEPGDSRPLALLSEGMAVEISRERKRFETVSFAPQSFTRRLQPAVTTSVEAAYMKAVLADKPMGYWPLNEPAGSRNFRDHSGNAVRGCAMRDVAAGQPGPLGDSSRAVVLDGNGYIDFGRQDAFARQNEYTVEAWVWIGDVRSDGHVISAVGLSDSGRHIGWQLIIGRRPTEGKDNSRASLVFQFRASGVADYYLWPGSDEKLARRWLHVATVIDRAGHALLYIDGEQVASGSINEPPLSGNVWLQIGCPDARLDDADSWRGRLAHIAVYPRALSAHQIQNHSAQRSGGKEGPDKQPL